MSMYQEIPLNQLVFSADNVRVINASKAADNELIAGIRSSGLLQNLIVRPNKKYYEVIAGGRRLAALNYLAIKEVIAEDKKIGCVVKSGDENITEISLMENTQRAAMHPADEFEAFRKMVEDGGISVSEVAERFGKSKKYVNQRLSLGLVSPKLLGYYRKGKLDLESVMAFTIAGDHDRQMACHTELSKVHRLHANQIKSWLTGELVTTNHGIGKFVGKAAYIKAGGAISSDLFEDTDYLSDGELVNKLATEKLEKAIKKLAGEGWAWVTPTLRIDYVHNDYDLVQLQPELVGVPKALDSKIAKLEAEFKRLEGKCMAEGWPEELESECDEAEAQLDAENERRDEYLVYTGEQKTYSGCFVGFSGNGELCLKKGLAYRKDFPQPAASGSVESAGSSNPKSEKKGISMALVSDLGKYRQHATKAVLVSQPSVAMDILHYTICLQMFESGYYNGRSLLDLNFSVVPSETNKLDIAESKASEVLNGAMEKLDTEWVAINDEGKRFDKFCELSKSAKEKLVTFCVASSLKISVRGGSKEQDRIVDKLNVPFSDYWRPTKENYLSRMPRELLISNFAEARGKKWANDTKDADRKKSDLVEFQVEWLDSPDGAGWIPEQF